MTESSFPMELAPGVDRPALIDRLARRAVLTALAGVRTGRIHLDEGGRQLSFGPGGAGSLPIVGDWDGNGTDTIGIFVQSSGSFLLKNANTPGAADLLFSFGPGGATWYPTSGHWNADNVHSIGVYDSSTGTFFLKNTNSGGVADYTFVFAAPGGRPLAGDFNGGMH